MADEFTRPVRLMNFVSEEQLDEAKKTRGERVEDGTANRDRPLFEILKENKDKRDAEFNERFKHRPPKALDDDETEFLDKLELSRREYEQQMADEDAQQIRNFQAAVAAQSMIVHEIKDTPIVQQEQKLTGKKNPPPCPIGMIIKVKPLAKKAKLDQGCVGEFSGMTNNDAMDSNNTSQPTLVPSGDSDRTCNVVKTSLVSYSDDSEDD